jgi:hypothetical protein
MKKTLHHHVLVIGVLFCFHHQNNLSQYSRYYISTVLYTAAGVRQTAKCIYTATVLKSPARANFLYLQ